MPDTQATPKRPAGQRALPDQPPEPTPLILGDEQIAELRERLGVVDLEQDIVGLSEAVNHDDLSEQLSEVSRRTYAQLVTSGETLDAQQATLHDLAERLAALEGNQPWRETPRRLAMKLAEVLCAIERIPKTGWNDHFKYSYATEADVADAIRDELGKRHVVPWPHYHSHRREPHKETGSGVQRFLHYVTLDITYIDGESGETLASPDWLGVGIDTEDKGFYKAMTGAMKYALLKTFQVSTGDDPETAETRSRPAQTGATPAQRRGNREQRDWSQAPLSEAEIRRLHAAMREAIDGPEPDAHAELTRMLTWKTDGRLRSIKDATRQSLDPLLTAISFYGANPDQRAHAKATLDEWFKNHPEYATPPSDATSDEDLARVDADAREAAAAARGDDVPFTDDEPTDDDPGGYDS